MRTKEQFILMTEDQQYQIFYEAYQRAEKSEEQRRQQGEKLRNLLIKFSGKNSDLKSILTAYSIGYDEMLSLFESSLNILQDDLKRTRANLKKASKWAETLSQGVLI